MSRSFGVGSVQDALPLRVLPRSRSNQVLGLRDGVLVIKLTAPPVDGAANEALLRFLAATLGVSRRDVSLVRGHTSRCKWIAVQGLPADALRQRLLAGIA